MIFCHIVDDYYLQGWLASAKQKKWWENQSNFCEKYKNDYIVALLMHSFSWSFMIMIPIAICTKFCVSTDFLILFFANILLHCLVDNAKANLLKINLIQDQIIHVVQIIITFLIMFSI